MLQRFFSRNDMGGFPDEEMRKALEEAIKNMAKPTEEPDTANFMQVVPDSHRFTLYGLKTELENLLKFAERAELAPIFKDGINYILTGLRNSEREDTEMI